MKMQEKINLDTIVRQATGFVTADMDGEKVMLNIERGNYYGLDGIGSCIWELIEHPCTVQAVVSSLLKEYDVDEKKCQDDVLIFLRQLHDQGLGVID